MLAALLAGALEDAAARRVDAPLSAVERQALAMPPAIDAAGSDPATSGAGEPEPGDGPG